MDSPSAGWAPSRDWQGGARDGEEGALCGGARTPSGSHALALLCTCLRARARRGVPAAAAVSGR